MSIESSWGGPDDGAVKSCGHGGDVVRDGTILSMASFVDMAADRGVRPPRPESSTAPCRWMANEVVGSDDVAAAEGGVEENGSAGGLPSEIPDDERRPKVDNAAAAGMKRTSGRVRRPPAHPWPSSRPSGRAVTSGTEADTLWREEDKVGRLEGRTVRGAWSGPVTRRDGVHGTGQRRMSTWPCDSVSPVDVKKINVERHTRPYAVRRKAD